jgi:L-asparagine transporter-like permease
VVALWSDAYTVMTALSTIALYASYGLPIAAALRARASRRRGPFSLGRWSTAVNVVALAWIAVLSVLFVLPPNQLAGYTFVGCLLALAIGWHVWMRARFAGPRIQRVTSTS